ncbi:MAG TPA: Hint domain-containing protein [Acetobacteraceae bacterium]|nr:Hint domain-containing protein [Acetobacteraceae bacterium]
MSGSIPSDTQAPATPSTYDFTGTTSSDWFTGTNWAGGVSPGNTINPGETITIATGSAAIGPGTLTSAVADNGLIALTGASASLTDSYTMAGSGIVSLDSGASFTFTNTKGSETGLDVAFGAHGTGSAPNRFDINSNFGGFGGTISNFGAGDEVILGNNVLPTPSTASAVALSYNASTSELTVTDSYHGIAYSQTLHLTGSFDTSSGNALAASVGSSGIALSVACFAEGTRILTTRGAVPVEQLAPGDQAVIAREGGPVTRPIIWIGHRSIDLRRHPAPEKVRPVRILAGACAPGLPERDLVVSPDHALFLNGVLIEAKHLVNGVTILWDERPSHVTYHHVELDAHDVLLAEGMAAESYIEDGNRACFANGGVVPLHPDFAGARQAARCAPLLVNGTEVHAVRAALRDRAMALGFSQTQAPSVTARAGAQWLECLASDTGLLRFAVPDGTREITLHSECGIPAETGIDPDDRRGLGIKIGGMRLIADGAAIPLGFEAAAGLHAPDQGEGRWSGPVTRIALPALGAEAVLELDLIAVAARWEGAEIRRQRAAG